MLTLNSCKKSTKVVVACLFWWQWHWAVFAVILPAFVTDSHRLSSRSTFSFCLLWRNRAAPTSPPRHGHQKHIYSGSLTSPLTPFYDSQGKVKKKTTHLYNLFASFYSPLHFTCHHIIEFNQCVLLEANTGSFRLTWLICAIILIISSNGIIFMPK